ncbi:MAG: hypothetical protein HQL38_15255 [Alphaproteobacteria bacterium]|nr:hypothetical protein [Alphaproteobacteria bacterium]
MCASDLAALHALVAALPHGRSTTLDPADPVHRAGIEAALAAANRTPERYPALHAALSRATVGESGSSLALIDGAGRIRATTWCAVSSKPVYSGGVLFLLDPDDGASLATASVSDVCKGFVPIQAVALAGKPAGGRTALLSLAYTASRAGSVTYTALATIQADPTVQEVVPTVTQPVSTKNAKVMIAVGRDAQDTAKSTDYAYTLPVDVSNPHLIVPFVGSALLPYAPIGTPGQAIPGASYATTVYHAGTNGTVAVPLDPEFTSPERVAAGVTISPDGSNTIVWSFPYDATNTAVATTQSLVYQTMSQVGLIDAWFVFTFVIPVDSPTSPLMFSICSTDTPNQTQPPATYIQGLQFWDHCLAADTLVTLADGGTAPIAEMNNRRRVRTGAADGASLGVDATTRGWHMARAGDTGVSAIYRLTTDDGASLVGTGMHAIMTPHGLRQLCLLLPGDAVTTVAGTARVARCEPIEWEGSFFNLKLGDAADLAAGLSADAVRTFVANGIVVADHGATMAEHLRLAHDVEHMLPRIAPSLATDFASAVADIDA